ncbi:aminotransferase class V-fold PLP-dependent enzyme [Calidifontibacter sp. DB0510]|uniref:Kynureninase n=1 Tax=Metallococcus carri TaxID=1656884 RepID=A0A967B4N8_9MICO|nr:aminotransferase class V-fold PLP-dependent enzyme [Metallococcus carri]NHN54566.1 aminotransferase class V-fold PLP-dependent enzyme [Metallococcus carri]NOP36595.1 aminotransferase class V-fold PLP-dependent enzyme [Calidifontibacter sp. DB2511S]
MTDEFFSRAMQLDAADPLAGYLEEFVPPADDSVVAYLDGNSLGRPLKSAQAALADLVTGAWGTGLIRSWTDGEDPWMNWPERIGDLIGRGCLGAAPGQTVVADSTTVMLYKLARAGVAARPGRDEIVLDRDNFPTDRYVLEGIAAERGLRLVWIDSGVEDGVTPDQVAAVVGERTALVVLSHVAYRSGWLADAEAITRIAHDAGALILWDLCHSVGSVPIALDAWCVDLAVGCTYKYLNGGPGAPAFGYIRAALQAEIRQPIQGWMGRAEPFEMAQGYVPAGGIRSLVSGTPPVIGMVPVRAGAEVVERAGIEAIREKSIALTSLAIELSDDVLAPLGVRVASPRDPHRRGGHVTIARADFRSVNERLWREGVIPDFRAPDGIRLGLSPLSTRYADVVTAIDRLAGLLR